MAIVFITAKAPFTSLPCNGFAPGPNGSPAALPSGVAPVAFPYTTFEVIVKTDNVCLAARNLANVKVVLPSEVNTYDLVLSDNLLITEEALKTLEEVLK